MRWSEHIQAEVRVLRAVRAAPWAVLAAAAVTAWVPMKMIRAAHGDPTTALAVLEASDKATVVGGLLVLLLPYAVVLAWTACCLSAATDLGRIRAAARGRVHATDAGAKRALLRLVAVAVPGAASAWLLAAAVPLTVAGGSVILVLLLCGWPYRAQSRPPKDADLPTWLTERPTLLAAVAAACVALLTFAVIDLALSKPLDDRMWLPPQALDTVSGPVVGYVLKHEDGVRTVLLERPREVRRMLDGEVSSSRYCGLRRTADSRSSWDRIRGEAAPRLSRCP